MGGWVCNQCLTSSGSWQVFNLRTSGWFNLNFDHQISLHALVPVVGQDFSASLRWDLSQAASPLWCCWTLLFSKSKRKMMQHFKNTCSKIWWLHRFAVVGLERWRCSLGPGGQFLQPRRDLVLRSSLAMMVFPYLHETLATDVQDCQSQSSPYWYESQTPCFLP